MEFLLHNEEGIAFPPLRPAYEEGELFFERFRALTPRGARDSVIGEGGTGLIHLVRDELMDRIVALKLPHESVLRDPSARYDVIRETRQAIELTHPHIVRIHDFHEGREGWGISMQYVFGKNLDEWRHEGRAGSRRGIVPYPVERIEGWISQLCDALIYAHEDAHMVHRDIKPKNLMLERYEDGREKLLLTDFGITQKLRMHTLMLSRVQPGTSDKSTMGTLPYMPWDQIQGAPASTLDDVYAVGATIYELLTGRPPFYEGGYEQIRTQIEKVAPPSMAQRLRDFDLPDPGIPDSWEETVAACLAKRPEDRPQSVREVAARLGLTPAGAPAPAPVAAPVISGEELAALRAELEENRIELQSSHGQLETARNETASLQARLEESASRIAELEKAIESGREALGEADGRTKTLDSELAALRQSLETAQSESARWKESYESLEKDLEAGQQEMLSRLQADIGEKDRQLAEALQQQEQIRKDLAALQAWQVEEEQYRSSLESDLAAARESAGAGAAEAEQRFQAEIAALKQAAADAEQSAAREKEAAAARLQELEQSAARQVEEARQAAREATDKARETAQKEAAQAIAEARTQAESAQKEAAKLTGDAKRAATAAEEAKRELAQLKTRQSAPLLPLLYVLLGALVAGSGLGLLFGKLGGGPAIETEAPADLSPFAASIPGSPGETGGLISAGLFRAFLADQGISGSEAAKLVPGLDEIDDDAPVTGVTWWVAEHFCAWLGIREIDNDARAKGRHFRIATASEIAGAGRAAEAPAEWASDPGDPADSPGPSARKIVTPNPATDGTWQMPSLGVSPGGSPLGLRVTLQDGS